MKCKECGSNNFSIYNEAKAMLSCHDCAGVYEMNLEEKTDADYEHFLDYSGLTGNEILRYAYFHGADIGLDRPSKEVLDAIPDLLSEMANYECRDTDTYSISVRIEDWHDRLKAATKP